MGGKDITRHEKQEQVVKAVTGKENQRPGKEPKEDKALKSRKGKSREVGMGGQNKTHLKSSKKGHIKRKQEKAEKGREKIKDLKNSKKVEK